MSTSTRPLAPGSSDPYTSTLLDLHARNQALAVALEEAGHLTGTAACEAALSDLHTQLRGMAAAANAALGGHREPELDPR